MTSPQRARATMSDVAAASGVSPKTVSRVVNGVGYVSAETLEAVRTAIDQLGFRRNEFARQLRQGTTATIGLVLEDVADPFYSVLSRAVEDVALAQDYLLLSASSAEDPTRSRRIIESFSSRGAAGLIIAPATDTDSAFLRAELDAGCSMVFVDRPVPGIRADTVLADNRGGAAAGTQHLIARGHRRIAFFGDSASVYTATERLAGYRDALTTAGIEHDDRLVVMAPPHADATAALIDTVQKLDDPPTAIFAGNNRWSVVLLRYLKEHGPRPLPAFLGFDDFELSDVLDPGITVIAQDPAAMGQLAAELLLRRVSGDDRPTQHIQLETRLIARGSGEIAGPFNSS
ncbi:LacI family DNA-binding transcriptional regulator [Agromyces subbeticus]|uniref:LacI family DNA-binding transcriptional regulator n=1 Tax=Agromyces subbeticus TaxID=293890 RepID=UPI0003B5480E|nr:LacI family DNA-binding transcriptional regulator [Agromyces subbeticus]